MKIKNCKLKIILSLAFVFVLANSAFASETNGTIVTGGSAGYAWSDQIGWVNFGVVSGNIHITDSGITGHAWNANNGWVNMDPDNGGVAVAASGALSGYAWGSSLGWINFSGVSINSSGKFTGTATGSNIGTLTFDCTNCNVTTDFRPANFRTTSASESVSASGSLSGSRGGSSVSGPDGQLVPAYVSILNSPLKLYPAQSGTLTADLSSGKTVKIEVPNNVVAAGELIISVSEQPVSANDTSSVAVLGGALFNITAQDGSGNLIRAFLKPVKITLTIPEDLQDRRDLGVYYFNEADGLWVKISDAAFSGNNASFYIDHLTLFGIFSGVDLPSFLRPFFPVPSQSGESARQPGESAQSTEETAPEQLFDIRLLLDRSNVSRIEDLVARVTFESFGRAPTPVDMTFSIVGGDGQELWKSTDTTTVQTEAVFVKRFPDAPELSEGSYTLRLSTLYNTDVKDVFEAPFTISSAANPLSNWLLWLMGALAFGILIILFFLWRRRRHEEESNIARY